MSDRFVTDYPDVPLLDGGIPREVRTRAFDIPGNKLHEWSHAAATELHEAGVGQRDRVAIGPNADPATRLCRLLGADLLGAAALLIEADWTASERAAVLDDARPVTTVDGPLHPRAGVVHPVGDGGSLFYLATTSGSSGRPKVLARDRRSWWASFRTFEVGIDATDTLLVPGSLGSSLFTFAAIQGMHVGAGVRLLERWHAEDAARACTEATALHLVPPMLAAMLDVFERRPSLARACSLRTVVCGGARVDQRLRLRLRNLLPGCELVEYYGSAEHSVVAIRRGDGPLRPAHGVRVRVADGEPPPADDEDQPMGERVHDGPAVGHLWVRSEMTFSGYLHGGVLQPTRPGWSGVGDRVERALDGSLSVLGRDSSTINTGAKLVAAEEVEAVLREVPGVHDVVVAPTPHPRFGSLVTAVIEPTANASLSPRELRRRVRADLESAKWPRRWLRARLPRTATGKPARGRVAEQLQAGTLDAEVLA